MGYCKIGAARACEQSRPLESEKKTGANRPSARPYTGLGELEYSLHALHVLVRDHSKVDRVAGDPLFVTVRFGSGRSIGRFLGQLGTFDLPESLSGSRPAQLRVGYPYSNEELLDDRPLRTKYAPGTRR